MPNIHSYYTKMSSCLTCYSYFHRTKINYYLLYGSVILILLTSCTPKSTYQDEQTYLFLGNSITYSGRYVDYIETAFILDKQAKNTLILNLGLSSETLTGMTERDHPFPRPSLLERLPACLDSVRPDHVIACYGINCGIYHPFDSIRYQAFQTGTLQLIREVRARNIGITLLTPGPFAAKGVDLTPLNDSLGYSYRNPYPQYDEVMDIYSTWILTLDTIPEVKTVDIRTPLLRHMNASYESTDPIHPNETGHAIIAESILDCWGEKNQSPVLSTGVDATQQDTSWQNMERLVREQRLSYDRPLLNRIGHEHPTIKEAIDTLWDKAKSLNQQYSEKIEARRTVR